MSELSPKQLAFCEEYVIDFNGAQAAIRAGYSEKTAREQASALLTKLHIKSKVMELTDRRSERAGIDAAWVLEKAAAIHDRCAQEVSPLRDNKGKQVLDEDGNKVYQFNASGAISALNLIAKHVDVDAFAADKANVQHKGKITIESLPEEQAAGIEAEVNEQYGSLSPQVH